MSERGAVRIGRVYSEPAPGDGHRILADRLWPRGIRKTDPRIDEWNKDVAPSADLRKWYGHEPERFDEFCARYTHELTATDTAAAVEKLRAQAQEQPVILLTATHDLATSHLVVLARVLGDPGDSGVSVL